MVERAGSYASEAEKQKDHHHHRISFPSIHIGRSSSSKDGLFGTNVPATLDWKLESPPIVFYGDAENSSGALVSGQLYLDVRKEEGIELESFDATLNIHVVQKRPYVAHCNDCTNQYTELKKWIFLERPLVLAKGKHSFPFSILLEGHLPTSMDGTLVSIAYEFKAEAVPKSDSSSHPVIRLEKTLDVKRSLPEHETPHHSVRVFPPTNIKASVHYPQAIHAIGNNTLSLRLDGLAKHNPKPNTVEYWKLKKLTWRLEETAKTIAPACAKHTPKEPKEGTAEQPAKKGLPRTDSRVIGEKTVFSGWKSNYNSVTDSAVELELDYFLSKHAKYNCNTKSRDGTEVTHQLMVEMVVSQEWAPLSKPTMVTQTGVGRILRMHFQTVLTERAGLGISWDNEAPPVYQDVPPSPPSYSAETRLVGDAIDDVIEPLDSVVLSGLTRRSTEGESSSAAGGDGR
ncbi:hypothetical protein CONLIGDRAFT_586634 [Coniochaeta ligniaria NRRL 30616]|uniref:LDB19 N-terminal domain-containing protein n=1 Tax=Coniochaeta ligniaria NRRL 30616 TaxID=1408157 RepID=A0A1J7I5Q5_9PEZI|nr:hypothetical protein CONLIGDRAFT_586634 [Coniochaeta ligniaria NRRL 30616]